MQLVGAEGSPVKNSISPSVGACVYAVALSAEISHVPFWRHGGKKTDGERSVSLSVLSIFSIALSLDKQKLNCFVF